MRRSRLIGLIALCAMILGIVSPAFAGHLGGRPESFQPDLSTGRFTSSIGIPVPPGRRGVQPSLALTYASGSSANLAGAGWTLEVGATERSTRFGVVTNPENANAYIFNIGGVTQELVAIGNNEYRAEAEGAFMKFKFTAPGLWEAWDRAGTYYKMDQCVSDPNGRVFAHYLSYVQDLHGNFMTMTYWRDPDGWQLYLTQIDYTGNTSGLQPTNKVTLTWEARPDITYSLKENLSNNPSTFKITQRLSRVETFSNNQLVRKHLLSYTISGSTGKSLLTSVAIYGSDGITTLPPTSYSYSVPSGNYQTTSAATWASGFGDSSTVPLMADVDRDSKQDLLTFNRSSGQWHYALSTGTGFSTPTLITTYGAGRTPFIGDFNGDGWIDLGTYDSAGNVDIALATGSKAWGSFARWISGFGTNSYYSPIPADFNGDGKTDFATWEGINGYLHMGLSNGSSFAWPGHYLTFGPAKYPLLGDFNGDGLTDVGTTDTSGNVEMSLGTGYGFFPPVQWLTGFASWQTFQPIPFDVNGDGLTDYATFAPSWGYWHWGTSRGNSFNWPGHYLTGFGTGYTPLIGDFNGDGMPDIGYYNNAGTWVICLRQGDKPDLMTGLDNGIGGTVSLTYASSTSFDNSANGTNMLGLSVPVLTSMTANDGAGSSYTTTFSYSGGVFDYASREFRGFAYAKVTDPEGHYTETYFHQDEHKKGRAYKEQVYEKPAGAPGPTETVDQQQTDSSSFWFVGHDGGDNCTLAQSFVLSGSGAKRIQKLDLFVRTNTYLNTYGVGSDPSGGFTVELQTDSGGDPSGARVDPNAIVLINPPQRGAWNSANFPVPLDLTAGATYWIVIKYAGTVQWATCYSIGANPSGGYASGAGKRRYPTSPWYDLSGHDLAFKVYLTQPATTVPPKLLQQIDRTWTCAEPYPGVHFTYLVNQTTSLYDGQPTPKQTKVDYTYDSYGNLTRTVESGDLAVTGDERTSTIDYVYNTTAWILGVPSHSTLQDANNQTVRESWVYYDGNVSNTANPTKGLPTKEEVWLSTSATRPTSTHTYNSFGNKVTTTDSLNRTTSTLYDSQEIFPIRVTNAVGHTLQTTYDSGTGNILTTRDPNGQITTNQYDPLGRITAVIGPLDTATAPGVLYSYDLVSRPNKRTKSVRTTVGGTELYTSYEFYDGMDRVIQVKSPAEDPTKQIVTGTQVFDNRGLVKEAYKPYLTAASSSYSTPDLTQPKVVFTYDPLGRAIKQTNPDNTFSTTGYNQWTLTLTDEAGKVKVRYMDAYGRLIKVEEKNAGSTYTTTYTYDTAGGLTRTVDARGNQTLITYDSVGRKTQMTDPDMGLWRYTYDAVGNLLSQIDAKGQTLFFTYDSLNRLTRKSGPSISVVYLYDDPVKLNCVGRLSKVTDYSGSTNFFYDTLGREIKTIKAISGVSYTFERTYDALNRLTTLKYPDNEILTYTYNPQGIDRITSSGGPVYVSNVDYTSTGQISKVVMNGILTTTNYTYDPTTLRLSNMVTTNGANIRLQDLSYSFDPAGNVSQLIDNRRNQIQTFSYDDLHRLTSANSPSTYGSRSYAYDEIGNLTLKDNVPQYYTSPKPHAVTSRSDGLTMTYDNNGNMITKQGGMSTQQLAYDAENRLIRVTRPMPTPSSTTSFVYDGDGGRVKKVSSAGTTTYVGKLYEKKPDGTFVKYIWLGSTRLCSKSSTGSLLFYHPNHLGSTDLLTDSAGTQVAHYEYTPYGELFSTEGVSVPHKFTGKELDAETGFYFYEARYYDPQLGRFITPDTYIPNWSNPQDFNRYTYASNNPLIYTDPTGHFSFKKFFKRAAGIITTAIALFVPPLAPAMWALNIGIGLYQGLSSGAGLGSILGGLAGGIIGGAAFGMLGQGLASGLATQLGSSAFTFAGGALIGAVEFGVSGFGAGFGGALGSGAGFGQALRAGGMGAAFGAVMGAGIQGSYMAGWQNTAHGLSIPGVVGSQSQSGRFSDSYFQNLSRTLESRRHAYTIYRHYGYNSDAATFTSGMKPGSFGTTDTYTNGYAAQQKLALPVHRPLDAPPDAVYTVTVDLSKTRVVGPSEVQPRTWPNLFEGGTVTRPGHGSEVFFPTGTPEGSVSSPVTIPQF